MKKTKITGSGKLFLNKKSIMTLTPEMLLQIDGGQQLPTGPHSCTVGSSVTCPPTMWPPTSPTTPGAPCCPAPDSFGCPKPVTK